jgi:thiol:disulfide interchange protein DsbC
MSLKQIFIALVMGLTAVTTFSAVAGQDEGAAKLGEKLKAKYANTVFGEIRPTPFAGIYEVDMGKNIAYTDANGELFLFGHIFDMNTRHDITADRVAQLNKVDFSKLPLDKAIKVVKGNGSRKFAVFSDPDCPFCKRLESTLSGVTDYTAYVFLFPIDSLHPNATSKSESIWCAKDRAAAWTAALTKGVEPQAKKCANPIADLQKLGNGLGVNGTPTIIRADGILMPGAADKPQLEAFLSGK